MVARRAETGLWSTAVSWELLRTLLAMDENRARRVVDALRERGINARTAKEGVYQFGVRIALPDGREAIWDSDGTAGLEAQVMRDGMLVGFVPSIDGALPRRLPLPLIARGNPCAARPTAPATAGGQHDRTYRPARGRQPTTTTCAFRLLPTAFLAWSGRRESNPHYQLGRLKFCH